MLGSTVPVRNGLHNCFLYGDLWECECVQIYSTLSRRWDIPQAPNHDAILKFREAYRKSSVKSVISHIPFLVNLCSKDVELQKKSTTRLETELIYNNAFGILYTVLHPGSNENKKGAIKAIANNINEAMSRLPFENKCTLLLETMSGQGNYLGSFEEISEIISLIEDQDKIGICLDTAHIYQNGYDLNNSYDYVMSEIGKLVSFKAVKAIHINDSLTELNSHVDRHAFIGEGHIKGEVFRRLINDPRFASLPQILELPDITRSQEALNILKSMREV